ncbi:MAG: hypothetical protein NVSMB64_12720 [Candidatus Velthaea sp.]
MGRRSWWLPLVTALLFASLFAWSLIQHNTVMAILDAVLFCINGFIALRLKRQIPPLR